jgi:signal transduction histidine kinase
MVCHRIIADHGGSIEVRSRAGEGASFTVFLPFTAERDRLA